MRIDFQFDTQYGQFCDALIFPDNQPLPSDDDIEAMKQQRLDNWLAFVTNPPPVDPPAIDPSSIIEGA